MPVFFAGDTPVISLTRQAIQGLGTYDTRLVIYKGGYAGTWGGGETGGKMFGNIVKNQCYPRGVAPGLPRTLSRAASRGGPSRVARLVDPLATSAPR